MMQFLVTLKRVSSISPEIAKKIDEDKKIDSVKIMSVLSVTSVRGVPQKAYGIDPATGELVDSHHPIGVIAAQSIGEPGTELSLDSKHRSGVLIADEAAQGLNRVEELFEARSPRGQAYLSDISGIVNIWEEGDHYIVQVRADYEEKIELVLDGQKPMLLGRKLDVGDVLAMAQREHNHILAPFPAKIYYNRTSLIVHPLNKVSLGTKS